MNTTEKIAFVKNILMPAIKSNKMAKVSFVKKDGTLREMTLHRSKALESTVSKNPSEATQKRQWTLSDRGMLCCEELTADKTHQFRTINCATIKRIAVNGTVTNFND